MTSRPGAGVGLVETAHFRVLGGCVESRWSDRLDNDLADAIAAELGPLGLVPDEEAFHRLFVATVEGSAPTAALAWNRFYRNTLARFRGADRTAAGGAQFGSVATFGRIYADVADHLAGTSVLDLGSCFGFLPLLLAERRPGSLVLGSDLSAASVALADGAARGLASSARFVTADATRLPFADRCLDTVTLVHLLEHLPAEQGLAVVSEAQRVARHRVLVAVPVEEVPDPVFGHVSIYSVPDLALLGAGTGWPYRAWGSDGAWLQLDRPGA